VGILRTLAQARQGGLPRAGALVAGAALCLQRIDGPRVTEQTPQGPLRDFDFERDQPRGGDLQIQLPFCGDCHADIRSPMKGLGTPRPRPWKSACNLCPMRRLLYLP
jgi:hypothetical protein